MQISLKKLKLTNFKGIRNLSIDFSNKTTNIYGKNATGKSSIADAFMWLLFNKNSGDKADFNIKTLDSDNKAIPKIDHSVEAVMEVNGVEIELCKTYREKWEVENGDTIEKFKGHETKHSVDGVPVSKAEYDKRVQNIIHSDIFKLVTNPLHFCSVTKWQDKRKTLFELSPSVTDEDVLDGNKAFDPLREILQKYEIEAYKKKLKSSMIKIQEQLDEIPSRIDEAFRSMPEEVDVEQLADSIKEKADELLALDKQLTDISGLFEEYNHTQKKIFGLQKRQDEIKHTLESKFEKRKYALKNKIEESERVLSDLIKYRDSRVISIASLENNMENKKELKASLLKKWHEKNGETLDWKEDSFICPTCKRALEEHDIDSQKATMQKNFDDAKTKTLSEIALQGKELKVEIEKSETLLQSTKEMLVNDEKAILEKEKELEEQRAKLAGMIPEWVETTKEYQDLQGEIDNLQKNLSPPEIDKDNISKEKSRINQELDERKKQLAVVDTIKKTKERISELEAQEKELAVTKANYQKELQMCDSFTKTKIEKIESSINKLFKYVKFKLFEEQINGGEKECCEVLIDGVPYADANHAAKINAGLDVINAISVFYDVTAPIFIDNRESVNVLIDCESQIINLFVTSEDEKLRVEVA